jgi:hypothetical protein
MGHKLPEARNQEVLDVFGVCIEAADGEPLGQNLDLEGINLDLRSLSEDHFDGRRLGFLLSYHFVQCEPCRLEDRRVEAADQHDGRLIELWLDPHLSHPWGLSPRTLICCRRRRQVVRGAGRL